MRDLIRRYFDSGLSRRGFARKLTQLGFTAAAAQAVLSNLDAAETAAPKNDAPVNTVAGTGGELVVAQARAAGVEYLFTNPGSFEVGFFDAIVGQQEIQMIVGLHEGIVISMADGYHKVSQKPAFVNLHVIAGTAQAAGQLYNASRDGSALVVTAGMNDNQTWSDDTILAARPGFDQKEVNRQFTKISWDARNADSLPMMLRRAFKTAAAPPGGPVYLAMAHYALEAKGAKAEILPASRFLLNPRTRPDAPSVEEAARLLVEAKNPLVITGDEVWKSGAQGEVLALAGKLGLPLAEASYDAFRNHPTRHEHSIGTFNMANEWVRRGVDLLVFVGARDAGTKLVPRSPELPGDAKIIRVGMDTAAMGRVYATDVSLVADVREAIRDLSSAVDSLLTKKRLQSVGAARANDLRAWVAASRAKQEAAARKTYGQSPIHPEELGAVLARTLDKDAIIVIENITGKYDAFSFGHRENEMMYVGNSGLGLGWGIGAATGAKLAAPDRQVVCTIGDGSVMYSASGFWTQVRAGIPVLTVVYNNRNYQTVRHAYHLYGGKMAASGQYAGMYLGDPDIDFVKLADSQGVKGAKAANAAELESALQQGVRATRDGKPFLIEVATARYGGGAESTWHEPFQLAPKRKRAV